MMLQRIFVHLSLILLFAFTQIGIVTHDVSHFIEHDYQSQQDKNSNENQCEQCIGFAHAADNHSTPKFVFTIVSAPNIFALSKDIGLFANTSFFYSARAPPQHSQT